MLSKSTHYNPLIIVFFTCHIHISILWYSFTHPLIHLFVFFITRDILFVIYFRYSFDLFFTLQLYWDLTSILILCWLSCIHVLLLLCSSLISFGMRKGSLIEISWWRIAVMGMKYLFHECCKGIVLRLWTTLAALQMVATFSFSPLGALLIKKALIK